MARLPENFPEMPDAPSGLKKCTLHDRGAIQRKLGAFLTENTDVPPEVIPSTVELPEQWTLWCDHDDQIVAAFRVDQSDWYLCTLKNAGVRLDQRGKGVGSKLYQATMTRALRSSSCWLLAADVDYDNKPSIKALERVGFKTVNRFCWKRGEKPADVLHYVRMPAKDDKC